MHILGINTYHGDASAALMVDGDLVAAVEEERFTRQKHDTSFPINAIRYCLTAGNLRPQELDHIALSRDPLANLGKRLRFAVSSRAGRRMAGTRAANLSRVLTARKTLEEGLGLPSGALRPKTHFVEHHLAHIASSYFVSPFDRAAVLSLDGFGDMVSAMWGVGEGSRLRIMGEVQFPHSLGVFYTALTQYLGFPKYGDEYKVMGLASYGQPEQLDEMRRMVRSDDMGYELDLTYFRHHREGGLHDLGGRPTGARATVGPWDGAAGAGKARRFSPSQIAAREHRRLDAETTRRSCARDATQAARENRDRRAVSGGWCCPELRGEPDDLRGDAVPDVYVQPAANDAGTSVGAAYYAWHQKLGNPRAYVMDHVYFGPEFSEDRYKRALEGANVAYEQLPKQKLHDLAAESLSRGDIVGWYQGRMEFGPRALGNRSILADPRRPEMKEVLNARIKHREPFRPFAPSILEEATGDWFTQSYPSPFMLMTYPVRPEKVDAIPAPTHVDGTGRLQTGRRDQNQGYYDLIKAFEKRTGVPVVLNTSFNENEPICHTPEEAVDTFRRTKMDVLVLGNCLARKPSG